MFCLGVVATLVALAHGAALVASERDLVDGDLPALARVRRQQGRYGGSGSRQQQGANRYPNDQRSGSGVSRQQAQQGDDSSDEQGLFSWNGDSNRNQQNTGSRNQQQQGNRNRPWDSSDRQADRQADQGGFWASGSSNPNPNGQADPRIWGSGSGSGTGVEVNGFGSPSGGGGFFGGGSGGGIFGGGGGIFGGNRPSIIGQLISRIGQGMASTVQGVSAALANKWNTKVLAARGLASSLFDTGRQAARSGLQAGMAHPRFAVEAVENVF